VGKIIHYGDDHATIVAECGGLTAIVDIAVPMLSVFNERFDGAKRTDRISQCQSSRNATF
jgi:hypothetical protein